MTYTFVVYGLPATKGSTVSFIGEHGLVTRTDCKNLAAWSQAVAWAARVQRVPRAEYTVAVRVCAVFQFVRPKSNPNRIYPTVRPDIDKVGRALLDALTGVAYFDDAQVVTLELSQIYGADTRTTVLVEHPVL